jgi:23S rRNA (cytosine1962-C5)-methyltransferase
MSSAAQTGLDSPLAGRLRKRARHLDRWARRAGVTAYRLFDRDVPGYHFAIDRYADWLWVSEFPWSKGSEEDRLHLPRREELLALLPEILGVPAERTVVSTHERHRWGESQYERRGEGQTLLVREGELRFEVNLGGYLDSGVFLDHRATRARVRAQARGTRFLNLFSYTGSFTVYAAAGGARSSVSVDLSKGYLAWAARNLAHNALTADRHRLVRQDVAGFLAQAAGTGELFDLVVCDPPPSSFSKAASASFEVQRDHPRLLEAVRAVLAPRGQLYFSSSLRGFELDPKPLAGLSVREITPASLPPDFHGTLPHRCWLISAP